MGGFLSAFKTKEAASVVLDFESAWFLFFRPSCVLSLPSLADATPSASEQTTHSKLQHVLERAEPLLDSLKHYEGCQPFVQKAISTPTSKCFSAARGIVGLGRVVIGGGVFF
jgi:hypothetical protein